MIIWIFVLGLCVGSFIFAMFERFCARQSLVNSYIQNAQNSLDLQNTLNSHKMQNLSNLNSNSHSQNTQNSLNLNSQNPENSLNSQNTQAFPKENSHATQNDLNLNSRVNLNQNFNAAQNSHSNFRSNSSTNSQNPEHKFTAKSLLNSRSFCFSCGKKLKFYHLVPIFSYLFLRGKCAFCGGKISPLSPLTELISGICFVLAFLLAANALEFTLLAALFSCLILLSLIDFRLRAVPEILLWTSFFLAFVFGFDSEEIYAFLWRDFRGGFLLNSLIFAGFIFLLKSLVSCIINLRKRRANADSLGDADIIIIAAFGGILGVGFGFAALFLAAFLALPFFVFAKTREMPFLPFLSLAFVIILCVKSLLHTQFTPNLSENLRINLAQNFTRISRANFSEISHPNLSKFHAKISRKNSAQIQPNFMPKFSEISSAFFDKNFMLNLSKNSVQIPFKLSQISHENSAKIYEKILRENSANFQPNLSENSRQNLEKIYTKISHENSAKFPTNFTPNPRPNLAKFYAQILLENSSEILRQNSIQIQPNFAQKFTRNSSEISHIKFAQKFTPNSHKNSAKFNTNFTPKFSEKGEI